MTAQIDEVPLASALHHMNPFGDAAASAVGSVPATASSSKERFYRYFQEEVTGMALVPKHLK